MKTISHTTLTKSRFLKFFILILFIIISGCSEEDESTSTNNSNDPAGDDPIATNSQLDITVFTSSGQADFGGIYPDFNASSISFSISNGSNKPINVSNIVVPEAYSIVNGFQAVTLGAFESQDYLLRFFPLEAISYSGVVEIISDADQGTSSFNVTGEGSTVAFDNDGNEYDLVRIGNQLWLAENYRGITYNNGTGIANASYSDTNLDNIYGKLYPRDAVVDWNSTSNQLDVKRLMDKFSVPNNQDWNALFEYLGGTDVAGGKMKQAGTELWDAPNIATNESGFTAVPAGSWNNGQLFDFGNGAKFWSYDNIDPVISNFVYSTILVNGIDDALFQADPNSSFYSVRLVQRKVN